MQIVKRFNRFPNETIFERKTGSIRSDGVRPKDNVDYIVQSRSCFAHVFRENSKVQNYCSKTFPMK